MGEEGSNQPPNPKFILAAMVRQSGRVRIGLRELDAVRTGHLAMRRLEDGTLILEFREGKT